jgi:hypothetical protein
MGFVDLPAMPRAPHRSSLAGYEVAVGRGFADNADVLPFQRLEASGAVSAGAQHAVLEGLSLQQGLTYTVEVRARDHLGHTTVARSNTVTVDITAPQAGEVFVGRHVGHHAGHANQAGEVACTTAGWHDPESGVHSYVWGIGHSAHYPDVWHAGVNGSFMQPLTLSAAVDLTHGHTYYCIFRCVVWCVCVCVCVWLCGWVVV